MPKEVEGAEVADAAVGQDRHHRRPRAQSPPQRRSSLGSRAAAKPNPSRTTHTKGVQGKIKAQDKIHLQPPMQSGFGKMIFLSRSKKPKTALHTDYDFDDYPNFTPAMKRSSNSFNGFGMGLGE